MIALGTKAPFFELPNPSKSNEIQSLEDLKGEKGTLVIFMCNHCPFVLHVIDKLMNCMKITTKEELNLLPSIE
jgi:peroxiredoxin